MAGRKKISKILSEQALLASKQARKKVFKVVEHRIVVIGNKQFKEHKTGEMEYIKTLDIPNDNLKVSDFPKKFNFAKK